MKLSIIIPVFNSEKILKHLINSIIDNLPSTVYPAEIILVNDCSADNSWKVIKRLSQSEKLIKGINLASNYGQHTAIFTGLKFCTGDIIICMDDDMQHDPIYINDIYTQLNNGFDVCYVKYKHRKHSRLKILISGLNHLISSYLMSKSRNIYTSSFKGFNSNVRNKILQYKNKYIFIDYMIIRTSNNVHSINIKHQSRLYGKTNYKLRQLITLWSKMIFSIEINKFGLRSIIISSIRLLFKLLLKDYIKLNTYREVNIKSKTF